MAPITLPPTEPVEVSPVLTNPPVEMVHSHIKTLTQVIQDLLRAAQSHKQSHFSPCSIKIARAVEALSKIFPLVSASSLCPCLCVCTLYSSVGCMSFYHHGIGT